MFSYAVHVVGKVPDVYDHVVHVLLGLPLEPGQALGVGVAQVAVDHHPGGPLGALGACPEPEQVGPAQGGANVVLVGRVLGEAAQGHSLRTGWTDLQMFRFMFFLPAA